MPLRTVVRRGVVVGRIGGVEIALHPTWLVVFLLMTVAFRFGAVPAVFPRAAGPLAALVAIGFALLFYAFVVAHELSHAMAARAAGLEARRVTLFFFGGVAQLGREATGPTVEFAVALAGPLASLIIGGVLTLVARSLHPQARWFPGTWGMFASINLFLGLFNLLPGFPLDGGRILRSVLWAISRDRARATRRAAAAGKGLAFALMLSGAGFLLTRRSAYAFPGIWGLSLGFFLYNLAGGAGEAEGGPRPGEPAPRPRRGVNLIAADDRVTPSRVAAKVGRNEGDASSSNARGRGRRSETRPGSPRASRSQPGDRPGHPGA